MSMPHLSFSPRSGKRYRVHIREEGQPPTKGPIIKKSQIGGYRRSFYGRLRRNTRTAPPKLPEARIFGDYADCPACNRGVYTSPRTVTCSNCGTRFVAIRERRI